MSEATAQSPLQQSASQLSENIGDVLASIRRLIAQDEAAEAAAPDAPPPARAVSVAPSGPPGVIAGESRLPRPDPMARRRDILAEAQALTRRSEAAFGRTAAAPLTLGPADRVSRFDATLPGHVEPTSVIAPPLLPATPALAEQASAIPPVAAAVASGNEDAAAAAPPASAAETKPEDRADAMTIAIPPEAAATSHPQGSCVAAGMPEPAASATPAIVAIAPRAPAARPVTDAEPAAAAPAVPSAGPVAVAIPPHPVPAPAPAAGTPAAIDDDEDCTALILREMIRDVVRQELNGDPSGKMPGGLRSMIMREVAQVVTQGARGSR